MSHLSIPDRWLSIDPGDRYCGVVYWEGTKVWQAREMSPEECVEYVEWCTDWPHPDVRAASVSLMVVERWALYAWNQASMAGNEFKTAQLIGTLKYIARRAGVEYVGQFASQGKSTYKRAPFKHWRARDWQRALGGSIGRGHTKDALAHGCEFIRSRIGLGPWADELARM